MNRKRLLALSGAAMMVFGAIWMNVFPEYPMKAPGFLSFLISGILFIEFVFTKDETKAE